MLIIAKCLGLFHTHSTRCTPAWQQWPSKGLLTLCRLVAMSTGLTHERDNLTTQLEQVKAEVAGLQQQLSEATSKTADLQRQLETSQQESELQAQAAEEVKSKLDAEIEELNAAQVQSAIPRVTAACYL